MFLSMLVCAVTLAADPMPWTPDDYRLRNLREPVFAQKSKETLPIVVPPFEQHVRGKTIPLPGPKEQISGISLDSNGKVVFNTNPLPTFDEQTMVYGSAKRGDETWYATTRGLYLKIGDVAPVWQEEYGLNGPLATLVTAIATDPAGNLWIGTPRGLSILGKDGSWWHATDHDELPLEHITAIAVAPNGDAWIGTPKGAFLYRRNAVGRKTFYRQGPRYLPGDYVRSIAISADGKSAWFLTEGGVGEIKTVTTTLLEKAQTIEKVLNERHRREGLVASCILDDAMNPTAHTIHDNDNDGLWTAYHVAAMSLAFGATKDDAAKASAMESMHALYMLQNASGIPGVVARSVVSPEIGKTKDAQWQPTPDGKFYWKSDTSSDEIDGHYLAFYTYFEHIAQHDPEERKLIDTQVRKLTDHLLANNYQLIDFNGKRTRWGFWDPESLNHNPMDYIESGLNSLQMLSFLKVTHYITGDAKYDEHYRKLAIDHHYLENVMLVKKSFPEENNHSDDQLGFVAWYPILQLEHDPKARQALLRGVQHHYEVVREEQPSFYAFAYATINPGDADLQGAVENLRQIPTDRRTWKQENSHRDDVRFDRHPNRFNKPVLDRVLPADERVIEKWNGDPYLPDDGGDGRHEDDGAAYLLPYWMGRYHGFIAE